MVTEENPKVITLESISDYEDKGRAHFHVVPPGEGNVECVVCKGDTGTSKDRVWELEGGVQFGCDNCGEWRGYFPSEKRIIAVKIALSNKKNGIIRTESKIERQIKEDKNRKSLLDELF